MGIALMPWQETAARYLTATGPGGLLLYREVAIVVARQNGKTTLAKPLIIRALRAGKRVMHLAQNRELPRVMFGTIADALSAEPDLFPKRRGRVIWPRYGSGQEEIVLANGGTYRIAAASRGGARGHPNDLVIVDELREMDTFEVIGAAEPTLTMSPDPQMVYLSNAGDESSVVLNAVRGRAGQDDSLAYLEWSAGPERDDDDIQGWAESNPAIGHYPSVLRTLELAYRRHKLAGTLSIFETEHLCRWVVSMQPRLVDDAAWQRGRATLETPRRPYLGISMDPSGTRASAVIAWQQSDGTVALRVIADVTGTPIDADTIGADLRQRSIKLGVTAVAFDPWTDADLARRFKDPRQLTGREYANASETFARVVESGRIRWDDADPVTVDLTWTARRPHESGAWQAVKAKDDRPITAALAAIRAVWLAAGERPPGPRVL
jgi:phage terminase large subunit-like protein